MGAQLFLTGPLERVARARAIVETMLANMDKLDMPDINVDAPWRRDEEAARRRQRMRRRSKSWQRSGKGRQVLEITSLSWRTSASSLRPALEVRCYKWFLASTTCQCDSVPKLSALALIRLPQPSPSSRQR